MSLSVEEDILSLSHHPTASQFAISQVTGHVSAYLYDPTDPAAAMQELWSTRRHKRACRAIAYSPDGKTLVTVGADRVIKRADGTSGRVLQKWTEAHEDVINAVAWVNETHFCTGDDSGVIKAWDIERALGEGPSRTFHLHEDYVSSLLGLDGKFILSTSGDGTLAVHDLRATKSAKALIKRSDDQEDDLTSSAMMKLSSKRPKLVVGTSSGVITLFNKGDWGDCNDRILPPRSASSSSSSSFQHAASTSKRGKKGQAKKSAAADDEIGIECLAKLDESRVIVGGADGKVRLLEILPNQYLRVIGDFETGEPVEDVKVAPSGLVLAVSGTELRIWNVDDEQQDNLTIKKEESEDADTENNQVQKQEEGEEAAAETGSNDEEGDQFSDSSDEPKRKKPKKTRPVIQEKKKNSFFDDM